MKLESKVLLDAIQASFPYLQPMEASDLSGSHWKSMKFNKSGKQILITTDTGIVFMVDGYDSNKGTNVFLSEGINSSLYGNQPAVACFSSDDQTVLVGNENGTISCYDSLDGSLLRKLEGHVGRVGCVACNPKYAQIASACTNVALWLW
jgi:COMPASS component SWD2